MDAGVFRDWYRIAIACGPVRPSTGRLNRVGRRVLRWVVWKTKVVDDSIDGLSGCHGVRVDPEVWLVGDGLTAVPSRQYPSERVGVSDLSVILAIGKGDPLPVRSANRCATVSFPTAGGP